MKFILLFPIAALLVLMATALFTKKAIWFKANVFLASACVSIACTLMYTLFMNENEMVCPSFLSCSHLIFISLTILFIYFYVALTTGLMRCSGTKQAVHLLSIVPGLGGYFYYHIYSQSDLEVTALSGGLPVIIIHLVVFTIFIYYLFHSFRMVFILDKREQNSNHVSKQQTNWLKAMLLLMAIYGFIQMLWIEGIAMNLVIIVVIAITYCAMLLFLFLWHLYIMHLSLVSGKNMHHTHSHKCQATSPEKLERQRQRLKQIMEDNLTFLDPDICTDTIAKQMNMKPRQFSHVISEISGKTFPGYVNSLRIQYALTVLNDPVKSKWNSCYIAKECGFKTREHFSKVFKATLNMSFEEYQHHKLPVKPN